MKFAFFNEEGRIESAHNDDTVVKVPMGARLLNQEQWDNRFNLRLVGEELIDDPLTAPITKLRADKAAEIDLACRNAIYAGFTSNALGAVYHYPAKDKDQANLVGSVTESLYPNLAPDWVTPFWCATGTANGEWAYRLHTAAQIQQVGTDAKAAIVAALTYNAQLQAQIAVADSESLEAIGWNL